MRKGIRPDDKIRSDKLFIQYVCMNFNGWILGGHQWINNSNMDVVLDELESRRLNISYWRARKLFVEEDLARAIKHHEEFLRFVENFMTMYYRHNHLLPATTGLTCFLFDWSTATPDQKRDISSLCRDGQIKEEYGESDDIIWYYWVHIYKANAEREMESLNTEMSEWWASLTPDQRAEYQNNISRDNHDAMMRREYHEEIVKHAIEIDKKILKSNENNCKR